MREPWKAGRAVAQVVPLLTGHELEGKHLSKYLWRNLQ